MRWRRKECVEPREGAGPRGGGGVPAVLAVGPVTLDVKRRRAAVDAWTVVLPQREAALLAALMHEAGRVIPYDELARHVSRKSSDDEAERHVRRLARRLRGRLMVNPLVQPLLEDVPTIGIRFTVVTPAPSLNVPPPRDA